MDERGGGMGEGGGMNGLDTPSFRAMTGESMLGDMYTTSPGLDAMGAKWPLDLDATGGFLQTTPAGLKEHTDPDSAYSGFYPSNFRLNPSAEDPGSALGGEDDLDEDEDLSALHQSSSRDFLVSPDTMKLDGLSNKKNPFAGVNINDFFSTEAKEAESDDLRMQEDDVAKRDSTRPETKADFEGSMPPTGQKVHSLSKPEPPGTQQKLSLQKGSGAKSGRLDAHAPGAVQEALTSKLKAENPSPHSQIENEHSKPLPSGKFVNDLRRGNGDVSAPRGGSTVEPLVYASLLNRLRPAKAISKSRYYQIHGLYVPTSRMRRRSGPSPPPGGGFR